MLQSIVVLCFIISMVVASGPWHVQQSSWALRYPEPHSFSCPRNLSITSVYSDFNMSTSQRQWKFGCGWNGTSIRGLQNSFGDWSDYVNEFQGDLLYRCSTDGAISGLDVVYDIRLADGRFRFGCNKFPSGYHRVNCSSIQVVSSSELQTAFDYVAADSVTVVGGFHSKYDIGLKDRTWSILYCEVRKVVCNEPVISEEVIAKYDTLQFGGKITYKCDAASGYAYNSTTGYCNESGQWSIAPPVCQRCAENRYCLSAYCTSMQKVCFLCEQHTEHGLPVVLVDNEYCRVNLAILNSLPEVLAYHSSNQIALDCRAYSYPSSPTVTWFYNGDVVQNSSRKLLALNGSLVLREPLAMDGGQYVCVAENSAAENASISVNLQLGPTSPEILNWTAVESYGMKETAILHCVATGYPKPNIIWYKHQKPLKHKGRIRILPNGSLVIRKAKLADTGHYRCKARNSVGYITRVKFLYIYERIGTPVSDNTSIPFAPVIQNWNLLIFVHLYDRVSLPCEAVGNPMPVVSWHKDKQGRSISGTNGLLVIDSVREEDLGLYSCHAENNIGTKVKYLLLAPANATDTTDLPTVFATSTIPTGTKHVTPTATTTGMTTTPTVSGITDDRGSSAKLLESTKLFYLFIFLACFSL